MIHHSECSRGDRVVLQVVGSVGDTLAECVREANPEDHTRKKRGAWFEVLNSGILHGTTLKDGDYILKECYDPNKHGLIE